MHTVISKGHMSHPVTRQQQLRKKKKKYVSWCFTPSQLVQLYQGEEEEEEESFPKCYFKKRSLIVYSCIALRKEQTLILAQLFLTCDTESPRIE